MPVEVVAGGLFAFCCLSILFLLTMYGEPGLYLYIGVAVVAANIKVLKVVKFPLFPEPIALGTVLFSSTYLATDILCEYYGPQSARRGVMLGFCAAVLMTVFMMFTLGFNPNGGFGEMHGHLLAIFSPSLALLFSGMISYLCSQYYDVWCYQAIRKLTQGKFLWLRNNGAMLMSSLIDSTIFSTLAWIVFAKDPLPWKTVALSYILGTYLLRITVTILQTPIIYWAKYYVKK
ncbi:MAG: hypothetical protein A2007_00075 [Verrucomicrobia bacterium GWC2_42_7]|nr:MAG: hypothetical protein A2007_00075 [Verrucomicrobia bacterium GWC2_42_7]